MDLTLFIFRLIAIVYLAVGVGILVDKAHYKKMFDSFQNETSIAYLGGLMALVAGYAIVSYHNVWVKDWSVLVTILGWMALVKGVTLLAAPSSMLSLVKKMGISKNMDAIAVFVLALGALFGYLGFVA